jgi:hypothetical protein
MQQFIPFEDDWDALANLRPEDLVPYRVGMLKDVRVDAAMFFPAIHQKPACVPVVVAASSACSG